MCTVSCGVGGTQQRFREVLTAPTGGGNRCRHLAEERFGCNEHIPCKDQTGMLYRVSMSTVKRFCE